MLGAPIHQYLKNNDFNENIRNFLVKHPFWSPLFKNIAGLLGVRKTTRLERFMSILDMQKKACRRYFKCVQGCAHAITCLICFICLLCLMKPPELVIYIIFLDQRYMCFLMKNEKNLKTLSDQQCSE